ncbi:MAG TPA: SMC-Scp complex subunit ScpB [Planctomycetota bacterium]|nr:SMC-Scp complex subunit ScpB [Planctomycetota bacterium]
MIEKAHDLPPGDGGDTERDGLPVEPLPGQSPASARGRSARRSSRAARGADELPARLGAEAGGQPRTGALADEPGTSALVGEPGLAALSGEPASDTLAEEPATDAADAAASAQLPLGSRLEALLFASAQPLSPARMANVLDVDVAAVNAALAGLVAAWSARAGAVDLVEIAGGFRFLTRPEHHADVANLRGKAGTERLSPAALETLAVVAYRQPIGRAEVEAVRGVQVGPVLRLLLDRDLIRVTGRSTDPGHPLLYGTTRRFLDHFGLKSLKALPDLKDLLESP